MVIPTRIEQCLPRNRVCFSDIRTSLSGRPSICSRVALLLVAAPLAGLLSCAWWLTVWSPVHGPREPTSGYVKLLLPPRQSRGNSLVGLAHSMISSARASNVGGMVSPSAFAVRRLSTSSTAVDGG